MTRDIRLLAIFVLLVLGAAIHAENINGRTAGVIGDGSHGVSCRPEEIVVVEAVSVPAYQEGLELRIDLPVGLRRYQNSFALLLYKNVSPEPSVDQRSYVGTRVYMRLLPGRESLYVRIPFSENHGITGDALTQVLPVAVKPGEFPLLATILPVMKGIPDQAFNENLSLGVSPLWKNEGTVSVSIENLSGDPDEVVSIAVDGTEVGVGEEITLEAGIHKVRVSSTHAPVVERTVAIEPGDKAELRITLDYRPPEITLSFPTGTQIILDGETLEISGSGTLEIEPGDHQITAILGDYEISRRFSIRPAGRVSIELSVDLDIVEYGSESGSPFGSGDG